MTVNPKLFYVRGGGNSSFTVREVVILFDMHLACIINKDMISDK